MLSFFQKQLFRICLISQELLLHFVAADANNVFENGYILTNYGVVKEVGSYTKHLKIQKADVIEHGSGIILPSLVNVHTHLELCALKGKIPYNLGFAA